MDYAERDEALTLLQLEQGMRIVEVKFGPADKQTGIPHSSYEDEEEDGPRFPARKGSQKLKTYSYKCHDPSIQVGDIVVVQVGYFYGIGTVMAVHTTIPPQAEGVKLKHVLSRADVSKGDAYAAAETRFLQALARSEANERLGRLATGLGLTVTDLKQLARGEDPDALIEEAPPAEPAQPGVYTPKI